MVDLHHDVLIGIGGSIVHHPEKVVAEALEHGLSTADCPDHMPSHTPQLLGLLVEAAVVDPDHLVVLDVL
eukprot:6232550-Prorocentrum_lima.AAC.1